MQPLPREALQRVLDAARSHGCEATRIKHGRKDRGDFDRDFLLMGVDARIFVRTKSHSKDGEPFATQLNGSHSSWDGLSYVVIVFREDIYVIPIEFVKRRSTKSGSFFFNAKSGGVSAFKSPEGFKRLLRVEDRLSVWDAIKRNQRSQTISLAALQIPYPPSPDLLLCSRADCGKRLGRQVYGDKKLKISCCSVDCLIQERKTRQ